MIKFRVVTELTLATMFDIIMLKKSTYSCKISLRLIKLFRTRSIFRIFFPPIYKQPCPFRVGTVSDFVNIYILLLPIGDIIEVNVPVSLKSDEI